MSYATCKTCGKKLRPESRECPFCGTLELLGIKIDHLIITIVSIALSITVLNVYGI